ncbi:TonB-dependent receptor [Xanthomonas vasicola]|nr:TonB-dependent receptor [Xanthomonas vasicola pv. musacearum NCPPB 4379]RJL80910.1 TonB-dependent receptor [Xanthomonas vasicola]RRJ36339.1 TonB-dependent receptor [Xanthomonas vasicola pv. musacearum]RJL82322.1 TonB-dependent receptor [Xanthomonas vasicola]RJL85060.1 TonB-dependent receptor [Xanthomonas vasicola]
MQPLRRSAMAISIALLLAAPAYAQQGQSSQEASAPASGNAVDLDTVQVRGLRASLIKSQSIKHDAEQIVDSVSAEDIGALPDRSVTESLQRVSGVTIDHFITRSDPDHFSAEGSGVMIRGMTQVRGELNGRDSFTADSGRGLSFEDIPAELMAGLDVYKNPSAEIIEGGLGGTVNLRTRMPFDQPGRSVAFNADANEGDLSKTVKPSGSLLISDRWNTELGEMGLMLDAAYSSMTTRSDGIQVEPFVRRTDPALLAGTSFSEVYVPGGLDWRQMDSERTRKGLASAFQWRPSDDTELYVQYMRSTYDMNWGDHAAVFNDQSSAINPLPGTTFTYSDDGRFVSGEPGSSLWRGQSADNDRVRFNTQKRYAQQTTTTTDLSGGFTHKLTSKIALRGDMQLLQSQKDTLDFTLFNTIYLPGLMVDLSGRYPSATIADPAYATDPSHYFWRAAMDHLGQNRGRELATRFDLEYTDDDSPWLRSFRAGIRATDRTQTNKNTPYNWGVISDKSAPVPGAANGLADLADYMTGSSSLYTFPNLFRGQVTVPTELYFPSDAAVKDYAGTTQLVRQIVALRGRGWSPVGYRLRDINHQFERTQAAYAVLYFGNDDALGVPVDGNIGVRVVQTKTAADGYGQFPDLSASIAPQALRDQYTGQFFGNDAKGSYTNVLPSFNMRFKFSDALQWRIAASKAMSRPDYDQLQAYLLLSATVQDGVVTRWTGAAGNPNLRPMKANQYDTALEWYFDTSDMMYLTLFYKDVSDYIANQTVAENYGGQDWLVTRPYNMDKGRIRGFEYGYTQFFDSWPGWLSGFGINANFTFVDSSGGVNLAVDPNTQTTVNGVRLPLEGLSRRSYNLAGIYEKGPVSARLAYNWRSRYLLTASDVITRLPAWADDVGQLDGSLFYRFTPHLQLGFQANNLTNTVTKVLMGPTSYTGGEVDNRLYTRSWFVNDRRYSLVLRMNW